MKRLISQLTQPAMLVALAALFVALGGTSWAVSQLPKNSVGSKQLKKNSVTASKVRKAAITSVKVKDGSLLAKDFKAGQLPRGEQGPAGRDGQPGPQGLPGERGPAGPLLDQLPSGRTLKGSFVVSGYSPSQINPLSSNISYPLPLPSEPQGHYLNQGDEPTGQCPGSVSDPQAAPGALCLYEASATNKHEASVMTSHAPRFGATPFMLVSSGGMGEVRGTWAVTAP